MIAATAFWIVAFLVFWATVGYPLFVVVLAALMPSRPRQRQAERLKVDIIIPAYNEETVISAKLRNTLEQTATKRHEFNILVLSDGSTDDTLAEAQSINDPRIEVVDLQPRQGKAYALNTAFEKLSGDVVVFTDANSMLIPGALDALLNQYGDPLIGGVCGAVRVARSNGGIAASEGLYWRYDQNVKAAESRLGGAVSAQGTLHSLRRAHVRPVPLDVADDFALSVRAITDGKKLAFEPNAVGIEKVTEKAKGEFGRRVRSTERGWRGIVNNRALINPFRTGFYSFKLLSHKVLRRLVPFLLIILFLVNISLLGQSWIYYLSFALQIIVYGTGLAAVLVPALRGLPGMKYMFFVLMALTAMGIGVVNYYRGRRSTIWAPVRE